MCGIAGIISPNPSAISHEALKRMADAISHRGPDGEGYWINPDHTVGFGHRRLSIIDLSPAAAQPMHYLDRYTIVYNGEIYNYIELRELLAGKGYEFHTHSDTEVILAAYHEYGTHCVEIFDGMFAFAIWDEMENELFAARDRFGEKPFFYFIDENEGTFYFSSEMKSLWAVGIPRMVDNQALLYFLALGYTNLPIEKERTFYAKIKSLPPSHHITINRKTKSFEIQLYWDIDPDSHFEGDTNMAIDRMKELFFISVKRRLRSDVELGTSLSGGLDSSCIAAAVSKLEASPGGYQCFSAGFPGFEKDESSYVKLVTDALGLQSHTVTPTAAGCADNWNDLCYHLEQPFGSASVFAQFKTFELAKSNRIKVLLDGQGSDEVFGGYTKYIHWWLQELIAGRKFGQFRNERSAFTNNYVAYDWGMRNFASALFPGLTSELLQSKAFRKMKNHPSIRPEFIRAYADFDLCAKPVVRELNDILYYDCIQFGLEELLVYADRDAMAHGCELRLPYLSHELVEFVFSLPPEYKMHQGFTKWILRESMKAELPAAVIWRTKKVGFEPPQMQWMLDPQLQELTRGSRSRLVAAGILNKELLNEPLNPKPAYAADNFDWRCLVAGTLISM